MIKAIRVEHPHNLGNPDSVADLVEDRQHGPGAARPAQGDRDARGHPIPSKRNRNRLLLPELQQRP